jgi:hypothetical protein
MAVGTQEIGTSALRCLSALLLTYFSLTLATPAMITVAPRFVPSNGDTDSPYFFGYYMVDVDSCESSAPAV